MQTRFKKTFFSNGKLLLTGEYTVLDGARALALPTKFGQFLDVEPGEGKTIRWKSLDADGSIWFDETFTFEDITGNQTEGKSPEAATLITILHTAWQANPEILKETAGFTVTTRLTFPRHWGLGTSSTLINNIANWFGINAFELLAKSFGGSGYDIACAQHDTPIIYQLDNNSPKVEKPLFNLPFANKLYFVYLNRKQDSRQAIAAYRERRNNISAIIPQVDTLTQTLLEATSLADFCKTLEAHEQLMSGVLGIPAVKQSQFPDFPGTVKSLGAWGGDFVLAISDGNPESYFSSKGFDTIIPYQKMVLNSGLDLSSDIL